MKLIISRDVLEQLDEIYDFLAQKSPSAAARLYHRLVDRMESLVDHPRVGPVEALLSDRPEGFRSVVAGKTHKILYLVDSEAVRIVAVWDCRRDPARNRNNVPGGNK